jgi:hypothetical protein
VEAAFRSPLDEWLVENPRPPLAGHHAPSSRRAKGPMRAAPWPLKFAAGFGANRAGGPPRVPTQPVELRTETTPKRTNAQPQQRRRESASEFNETAETFGSAPNACRRLSLAKTR